MATKWQRLRRCLPSAHTKSDTSLVGMALPIQSHRDWLCTALVDHLRRSIVSRGLYAKIPLRSIMALQNGNVCDVVCRLHTPSPTHPLLVCRYSHTTPAAPLRPTSRARQPNYALRTERSKLFEACSLRRERQRAVGEKQASKITHYALRITH